MVMNRQPVRSRRRRPPRASPAQERLGAAEFKARCLELMNRVRESGVEYVVTKHGRPIAKLVPYTEKRRPEFFGAMAGTILKYDRPFDPIEGGYDVNRA